MSNPFSPSRSDHEPEPPEAIPHTRQQEIKEVCRLWTSNRLTILNGHPGVGKSVLLHSGVIPALEKEGRLLLPTGQVTHHVAFPRASLPPQNHFTFPLLSSWAPHESPAQLSESSIQRFLRRRLITDGFGFPTQTHLCIDQAEKLFQGFPEQEAQRLRFLEDLFEGVRQQPHVRLLLVLRTALLNEAQAFADRLDASGVRVGAFQLDSLRPDLFSEDDWRSSLFEELRTIRTSKGRVLRTPEVDPSLFDLACTRFASEPPQSPEILPEEVNRVLGDHVQRTLAVIAADHRLPLPRLETWFRHTFITPGPPDLGKETPPSVKVLRALEDRWLIKAWHDSNGTGYEIQHPRLREAVQAFSSRQLPIRRADSAGLLREAAAAFWSENFQLARDHVQRALQSHRPQHLEIKAQAACLLGDLAYAEADVEKARKHYKTAAGLFEALRNTELVGHLLSADGRLSLKTDPPKALQVLHAAASRLPHDPHVLTALGQALWQTGRTRAALTVLNEVLIEDGNNLEALRVRGELHADLGEAESALQDLDRIDRRASSSALSAWILANAMRAREESRAGFSQEPEELDEVAGPTSKDNGPVLLRVARVRELSGNHPDAAEFASRALLAQHPPIPPQLLSKAEKLKNRT